MLILLGPIRAAGSGLAVRRFGRRQIVAVLALLPLAGGNAPVLLTGVAVCLMSAAYAATSTIVNTVNMDLCREGSAGTSPGAVRAPVGGVR